MSTEKKMIKVIRLECLECRCYLNRIIYNITIFKEKSKTGKM